MKNNKQGALFPWEIRFRESGETVTNGQSLADCLAWIARNGDGGAYDLFRDGVLKSEVGGGESPRISSECRPCFHIESGE